MSDPEALKRHRIFASLPAAVRAELLKRAASRALRGGETLEYSAAKPGFVWFVCDGLLELSVASPTGRSVTLDLVTPGDSIGYISLALGQWPWDVRALRACRLAGLSASALLPLLRRFPAFGEAVRLEVALTVRRLAMVRSVLSERAQSRVAGLLLLFSEKLGSSLPLTRQTLAAMTGLAPESVSRSLQALERGGIIKSDRGAIAIRRPEALRDLVRAGSAA